MNGFLLSAQACAATTVKNFDLTETLSLLLVFGPIWLLIALLLVPIVLYLYVHNINGYMKVGAQGYTYMPQPMGTLQRPTAQDNTEGTADILDAVYRQFKTGRLKTLIIAFIYLACLCSLLILKDVSARESDMFEDALGMAWFCVLLSLPVFFLLCDSHKPALLISAALAVVAGVGVIQEAWQSGQEQSSESVNDFFWVMAFGMFFYAALCIRRYRRLVPFFTIVLMIAPIGMLAILVLIYWTGCTGWNIHKRDQEIVWLFLLLAAPCFWLLFTWMGLRFFSVAYTRRRISEQQLSVSCWFIITGLFIATLLQVEDDDSVKMVGYTLAVPPLMLLTLGAYLEISRVPSLFATPRSLLYLRVFRSSAQSRKLFRSAARPWRSVGPVNLIAGPDLAKLGVEPDEIYQFLCGNLHRLFIRTPEQLELAFNKPLNTTDPDGRYRVNEFFCFDGIWQSVAERLIARSDFVLIDLREFSLDNLGAVKEIGLLADSSSFTKTLFVVEDQEKQSQVAELIASLTGYRIELRQIVCVDTDGSDNLMRQILDLRFSSDEDQIQFNEEAKTLDPHDLAALAVINQSRHEQLIEQHRDTRYPYSFVFLALSVVCMFGIYGIQFIPALYLKIRGVSWNRCLRVFGLIIVLIATWHVLQPLYEPAVADVNYTNPSTVYLHVLVFFALAGSVGIWVWISRHVNRWIEESREPLRSALLRSKSD